MAKGIGWGGKDLKAGCAWPTPAQGVVEHGVESPPADGRLPAWSRTEKKQMVGRRQ